MSWYNNLVCQNSLEDSSENKLYFHNRSNMMISLKKVHITANLELDLIADDFWGGGGGVQKSTIKEFSRSVANIFKIWCCKSEHLSGFGRLNPNKGVDVCMLQSLDCLCKKKKNIYIYINK